MDSLQLWQRYCDWLYYHPGLEIFVDISRIRFTPPQVEALRPRFAQAFADMQALEAGAIANPDEGRQVGHYWLRAPELAPTPEIRQAIQDSIERVETFAEKIHRGTIPASGGDGSPSCSASALAAQLWGRNLWRRPWLRCTPL